MIRSARQLRTDKHFTAEGTPIPAINFDNWELEKLRSHAARQTLTYLGYYAQNGLTRPEVDEMNRWRRLSAKLSGESEPEELKYRGR